MSFDKTVSRHVANTLTQGLGEGCGYQPVSGTRSSSFRLCCTWEGGLAESCVAWEEAPGPVSGSLARHKSSSKSVSIPAMACSVLKHCGKQGSGSKVSVEQVQVTFGKFPRTNALSVKFSYDFFFFFCHFWKVLFFLWLSTS